MPKADDTTSGSGNGSEGADVVVGVVVPPSVTDPDNNSDKGLRKPEFKDKFLAWAYEWFPALVWVPKYNVKENLRADVVGGIVIGVMLIPQGIAYAQLANLSPVHGLYAAFAPLFIYAAMGSCRQVAIGPTAVISTLAGEAVAESGLKGDEALSHACAVALVAGGLALLVGMLRLGWLVQYLSRTVIHAFTAGAATIIIAGQLGSIVNIKTGTHSTLWEYLKEIRELLEKDGTILNLYVFLVALGFLAYLIIVNLPYKPMNKIPKWIPHPLIVVIASTLLTYYANLEEEWEVRILKKLPEGMPPASVPSFSHFQGSTFGTAAAIAIIGFIETYAIGSRFAEVEGYRVDADTELRALGLKDIVGAFFSAYPTSGSISRTAVQYTLGVKSQISEIVTCLIIMLSLIVITRSGAFYYVPKYILSVIIISAVYKLIDPAEPYHLWKKDRFDACLWVLTYILCVLLGIDIGIGIGVGLSMLALILRMAKPQSITHIDGDSLVFEFHGSLYFSNMSHFEVAFFKAVEDTVESTASINHVVINMWSINDIDLVSSEALYEAVSRIHKRYSERSPPVSISMTHLKRRVWKNLKRSGTYEKLVQLGISVEEPHTFYTRPGQGVSEPFEIESHSNPLVQGYPIPAGSPTQETELLQVRCEAGTEDDQ